MMNKQVPVISMILFVLFFCASTIAFVDGDGTLGDPYQISTKAELEAVNSDLSAHYILVANINLDPNLPGGQTYTAAIIAPDVNLANIDYDGTAFSGTFDGDGYTISNVRFDTLSDLSPDNDDGCYLGIFGMLASGADVKNLNVTDGIIRCDGDGQLLGAICGWNEGGSITNCQADFDIDAGYEFGGICGWNSGGTITDCNFVGNFYSPEGFEIGGI